MTPGAVNGHVQDHGRATVRRSPPTSSPNSETTSGQDHAPWATALTCLMAPRRWRRPPSREGTAGARLHHHHRAISPHSPRGGHRSTHRVGGLPREVARHSAVLSWGRGPAQAASRLMRRPSRTGDLFTKVMRSHDQVRPPTDEPSVRAQVVEESMIWSKARALLPSPRPVPLRAPYQTSTEPSGRRVRW